MSKEEKCTEEQDGKTPSSRFPLPIPALSVLLLVWLLLQVGVPFITKWTTGKETTTLTVDLLFGEVEFEDVKVGAPMPGSLVSVYMGLAVLAVLLFVTSNEQRIEGFFGPIKRLFLAREPRSAVIGKYSLVGFGAFVVGFLVYDSTRLKLNPPAELRTIHPTLPGEYANKKNPHEWTEENLRKGREIYVANCSWCHGDRADGKGPSAAGYYPEPIDFTDPGTIAQLPENYIFWRAKEGGIGLPDESAPWSSAMPPWNPSEDHLGFKVSSKQRLSDRDIWLAVMGAYSIAGQKPAERD